ncbi:ABC transporter permease [Ihubacter massiliensis]|uniref:ABC transporter permease n=1 Tax=Hominibacterium faecale TaxID=2839743 RepID=A0A9J6QYX7_9FIRM|nr:MULTISPECIES: ABC transporter permease [Eubacteriales Family XIII. Incertae Sedis]MCI7303120.1 ABC transporter permease [Clostridia bacterium]MCO7123572.1 ABC transporter permease [Ihubacter massiliensis]MCU7380668.1 ABC transporter permease [Hominibacterium faecale]MDY3012325.1 ABC transporter permease [Clostridiales Family XIII bacterium]
MKLFTAEFKKLLLLFRADPKSIAAGVIAPTIILIIFALTFGNFSSLRLAYVNEDPGTYGKVLEKSIFSQISPLGDKPYFEEVKEGREAAMDLYQQGKVNGVVLVSGDFSGKLEGGGNADISYFFNNYNSDMAKNLRLYLNEGILDFYRATDKNLQVEVEEILNVETQLDWFHIIAVAVFLLAFLLGSMFNVLYLLYKEKTYNTLFEYQLSPRSIMTAAVILWFLSGATGSIKYTTGLLKSAALCIPNTYGLSQIRGEVFSMDPSVCGMLSFREGWLIMIGYLVVSVFAAAYVYRKRLACVVK